jgi:hypothetical protein
MPNAGENSKQPIELGIFSGEWAEAKLAVSIMAGPHLAASPWPRPGKTDFNTNG